MSYSIVPSHMAGGKEWGPTDHNADDRNLVKVAQFSGEDLRNIDVGVTAYLAQNPGKKRDHAVQHISDKRLPVKRVQVALDTLNQLGAVGKSWADIRSIEIHEDTNNAVSSESKEGKHKAGEGEPHLWYTVDWINPPKPVVPEHIQKAQQILAESQRRREAEERRRQSEERRERARQRKAESQEQMRRLMQEHDMLTWQRELIDDAVIDNGMQNGNALLHNGQIKIDLGEDGIATILLRQWGDYHVVDRTTGAYKKDGESSLFSPRIKQNLMRYFNFRADQAEGKDIEYAPEPLSKVLCEDIFKRAIDGEMIRVVKDPERGTVFQYAGFPNSGAIQYGSLFMKNYAAMDLDTNTVKVIIGGIVNEEFERPIHPHFAEFLREKKAALDTEI